MRAKEVMGKAVSASAPFHPVARKAFQDPVARRELVKQILAGNQLIEFGPYKFRRGK